MSNGVLKSWVEEVLKEHYPAKELVAMSQRPAPDMPSQRRSLWWRPRNWAGKVFDRLPHRSGDQ